MKKQLSTASLLAACIFLLLFSQSCSDAEKLPEDRLTSILKGEHVLRKMSQQTMVSSTSSSSFFLFSGTSYTKSSSDLMVTFAWKMNDSSYALSSLPFGKIRIRFDESKDTPTIKFRWGNTYRVNPDEIDNVMKYQIIYALISVKSEDWPQDIRLPMNIDTISVKK